MISVHYLRRRLDDFNNLKGVVGAQNTTLIEEYFNQAIEKLNLTVNNYKEESLKQLDRLIDDAKIGVSEKEANVL